MFRKIVTSLVMAASLFAFAPSSAGAYTYVSPYNEWNEGAQWFNEELFCFEASFPTGWRSAASGGMAEWNDIQGDPVNYLTEGGGSNPICSGTFGQSYHVKIRYVDYGDTTCVSSAVTTFNTNGPNHTGATISVNSRCNWSGWNWSTAAPLATQHDGWTLIAHEAGHALGLGHMPTSAYIMCTCNKLGGHRYIDLDAVNGANSMYP